MSKRKRPPTKGEGKGPSGQVSPQKLDLSRFSSLEDAITQADPGDRYDEVVRYMAGHEQEGVSQPLMFFLSCVARCQGLHSAIVREIRECNPHAVFPLMRAFAETVAMLIYVIDHPKYIDVLTVRPKELPKGSPNRKSPQALLDYASEEAPGFKHVYGELSEITHFGSVAMWASHEIEEATDSGVTWTWGIKPRFRGKQAEVACAQIIELSEAAVRFLRLFADRHLRTSEGKEPEIT